MFGWKLSNWSYQDLWHCAPTVLHPHHFVIWKLKQKYHDMMEICMVTSWHVFFTCIDLNLSNKDVMEFVSSRCHVAKPELKNLFHSFLFMNTSPTMLTWLWIQQHFIGTLLKVKTNSGCNANRNTYGNHGNYFIWNYRAPTSAVVFYRSSIEQEITKSRVMAGVGRRIDCYLFTFIGF